MARYSDGDCPETDSEMYDIIDKKCKSLTSMRAEVERVGVYSLEKKVAVNEENELSKD